MAGGYCKTNNTAKVRLLERDLYMVFVPAYHYCINPLLIRQTANSLQNMLRFHSARHFLWIGPQILYFKLTHKLTQV